MTTTITGEQALSSPARKAVLAMYAGLALSLVAVVALAVDLAGADTLSRQLRGTYPPDYGAAEIAGERSTVLTVLFAVGALGVLCWLWLANAVKRQRSWARTGATVLFLLGTVEAGFTAAEILPAWLGLVRLLPCVAGLAAVALLWTNSRGSAAS